jgi:hypothetical protein
MGNVPERLNVAQGKPAVLGLGSAQGLNLVADREVNASPSACEAMVTGAQGQPKNRSEVISRRRRELRSCNHDIWLALEVFPNTPRALRNFGKGMRLNLSFPAAERSWLRPHPRIKKHFQGRKFSSALREVFEEAVGPVAVAQH